MEDPHTLRVVSKGLVAAETAQSKMFGCAHTFSGQALFRAGQWAVFKDLWLNYPAVWAKNSSVQFFLENPRPVSGTPNQEAHPRSA